MPDHRFARCLTRAALAALLPLACRTVPTRVDTPIDRATAKAAFETAWSTVETGDADPTHGGLDWKAVKAEFEPRAESCTTREQLREVLQQMLARLGRSHFGVVPASTAARESSAHRTGRDDGTLGLTLRVVDRSIVVTGVKTDAPAASAGVQRGWKVRSVDGVDRAAELLAQPPEGAMARYALDAGAQALDHGATGSRERWVFTDAAGTDHGLELARTTTPGDTTQIGILPPLHARCTDRAITPDELRAMGLPTHLRIAVIEFNIWMPAIAGAIDAAVDRHRGDDGIVLDLRGNPGGVAAMSMGVAGHFHDQPDSLGTMRTRDATLEFRVNPRRSTSDGRAVEPFKGPLVIVVDPLSASTSEIFAAGLQSLGRAKVVGRASAGAALPAQMRELPGGDGLIFAFADFTTPGGEHLEGSGVQPDEITGLAVADWNGPTDPDLLAATRLISTTLRNADCH